MIDIHPPAHGSMTTRDFFTHLGIVVLGILIAIGLEQSVEYFHHRDQVSQLTEQMRAEAQNNLPLIRDSIDRLKVQATYIRSLEGALLAGNLSGDSADVHGVPPNAGSALYVSPSRATWSAAQSAGLAALFPADQTKLFARLDYNTEEEISADEALHEALRALVSQCLRAQYDHANPAVQRISLAHRDDLLFQLGQVDAAIHRSIATLALVEGGDEAILARVHSLDEMYSFQTAAVERIHFEPGSATFFGVAPKALKQTSSNQPGATE